MLVLMVCCDLILSGLLNLHFRPLPTFQSILIPSFNRLFQISLKKEACFSTQGFPVVWILTHYSKIGLA